MRSRRHKSRLTRLACMLKLCELIFSLARRPKPMAPITTKRLVKRAFQSKLPTISSSNASFEYMRRLMGSMATDKTVDTAVIVTESAKSALNMELDV